MVACKEGKYALVEKLLERGASLSDIDLVSGHVLVSCVMVWCPVCTALCLSVFVSSFHFSPHVLTVGRDDAAALCCDGGLRIYSENLGETTERTGASSKCKLELKLTQS